MQTRPRVHVVSHGPGCLDGLVSAVVLARSLETVELTFDFPAPRDIDFTLRNFSPRQPQNSELWVTDISWSAPETNEHLASLVDQGLSLFWMDHHKSALDRIKRDGMGVEPTEYVLDMERAGCRIVWDFLAARTRPGSEAAEELAELRPLVMLADDVDRWILEVSGSRDIALAISAMQQDQAFDALMEIDADLRWTRSVKSAMARVRKEIALSVELAESTQIVSDDANADVLVVAAECIGYSGEVAERWKAQFPRTVFALLDRRAQAVSLRRSTDCPVDLSELAASFGGGGHAAAAGFDLAQELRNPTAIARAVTNQLNKGGEHA